MKLILIPATIILAGVVIFRLQSSHLKDIQAENKILTNQAAIPSTPVRDCQPQSRSQSSQASHSLVVSLEEANSFGTEYSELMAFALENKGRRNPSPEFREKVLQLFQTAQEFSPENIETVIGILNDDSRFSDKEEVIEETFENIFVEVAPFSTLAYLLKQPSEEQYHFLSCFCNCAARDHERTFAIYEEHKESPAFDNESIRDTLLMTLAQHDPDRMFTLMHSEEFASDKSEIGASVVHQLDKVEYHLDFIEAMQRAKETQPDSEKIEQIRKSYISQLSNQIERRGFEEAQQLINAGFNAEERMAAYQGISRIGGLSSAEEWGKAFREIELSDWNTWIQDQPNKSKHPFVGVLQSLGHDLGTAQTAEKILATVPAGELRAQAIKEYTWALVSYGNDPETATKYLDEIPEGKYKTKLQKRIAKAKK